MVFSSRWTFQRAFLFHTICHLCVQRQNPPFTSWCLLQRQHLQHCIVNKDDKHRKFDRAQHKTKLYFNYTACYFLNTLLIICACLCLSWQSPSKRITVCLHCTLPTDIKSDTTCPLITTGCTFFLLFFKNWLYTGWVWNLLLFFSFLTTFF